MTLLGRGSIGVLLFNLYFGHVLHVFIRSHLKYWWLTTIHSPTVVTPVVNLVTYM